MASELLVEDLIGKWPRKGGPHDHEVPWGSPLPSPSGLEAVWCPQIEFRPASPAGAVWDILWMESVSPGSGNCFSTGSWGR